MAKGLIALAECDTQRLGALTADSFSSCCACLSLTRRGETRTPSSDTRMR